MILPHVDSAEVAEAKIREYLLNPLHPGPGPRRAPARDGLPMWERRISMLKEHERIVLTKTLPADGLEVGDVGTIVHVYDDGRAYEVEFIALDGHTTAVATVATDHVRRVCGTDMTHARDIQAV
jgi:Domain of unknown function (DUF4926)